MRYFAKDIIEAAKSDKVHDAINAKEIAEYHDIAEPIVREEIVFVRKRLPFILGE